jgi:hypothetical protein
METQIMNIHRTKRPDTGWVSISQMVFRTPMSPKALGVLCYLLSKPDDWDVQRSHLRSHFDVGRDQLNGIFDELCQLRFMRKWQKRTTGQKWTKNSYYVFDEPHELPAVN